MSESTQSKSRLSISALVRILAAIPALMLFFFLPAGTLRYWEAWVYIAILMSLVFFAFIYLLKKDPALLERRLRSRETQSGQSSIMKLSILVSLLTFLIPGFDHRFNWSQVSVPVVIIGEILVIIGYVFIIFVWRENTFTARTVEIEKDHKVITTGPYSLVRHPMYLGYVLMYMMSTIALGSWWALIPSSLIIPVIIARIIKEEAFLASELNGYQEYIKKTRYRLLPGIW